jgi:glutamyl/glutaminyl-tRNA synthetase
MISPALPAYRGRLAPSPTGYLHLGHARTFWTAQERAQTHGGAMVLRIEDLDAERCKPEYADAILADLRWFGFQWQEGPDVGGPFGPYRQSERAGFYLRAWEKLASAGLIYPCECSRKDVQRALQAPHAGEGEPVYPGLCCPARAAPPAQTEPTGCNWRFRVTAGESVQFHDGRAGAQCFAAGRVFGDFLVWRKDGSPAYQLAVVVDDAAMRISEVVRGEDLLLSTAQQLLLYRALGLEAPAFYHCPLVTDAHGERLAKRTGAHSLRALREAGVDPQSLRSGNLPAEVV